MNVGSFLYNPCSPETYEPAILSFPIFRIVFIISHISDLTRTVLGFSGRDIYDNHFIVLPH